MVHTSVESFVNISRITLNHAIECWDCMFAILLHTCLIFSFKRMSSHLVSHSSPTTSMSPISSYYCHYDSQVHPNVKNVFRDQYSYIENKTVNVHPLTTHLYFLPNEAPNHQLQLHNLFSNHNAWFVLQRARN